MDALTSKEKIGVALLSAGVVGILVGSFGGMYSNKLELTDQTKKKLDNIALTGGVSFLSGWIYLGILANKR